VEFNDGSQYRVLSNPDAQFTAGREMYAYRASSARNGALYVDTAFDHHREITGTGFKATLIYQYAWQAFTPEIQANYFASALSFGLQRHEMVCLDLELGGGFTATNVGVFATAWLTAVEALLDCKAWVYVPGALSSALSGSQTAGRIVWAPRYSGGPERGAEPTWRHDVHQYTNQGFFPGCDQTGDVSYTSLSPEEMLRRCNPNGFNEPPHGGSA
jgi:GH25 family lysozyme M1 (1,4-beta-N-acetylmuramidase)